MGRSHGHGRRFDGAGHGRSGRILYFKAGTETHKVKVSSRRTKVTIAGNKTKRKNLKVGMSCKFTYPENGGEARRVDCK